MYNQLLEGDAFHHLAQVPERSVHLILCDLPYGTTQNAWECQLDLPELWRHYQRILVPNGVVVLTAQGVFTARLILSNEAWFKYKLVWIKSKATNFLNARKQPLRRHEDVCVFYKGQATYHPQMREGKPYDKGVRKEQLTGSYGEFQPVRVRSEGGRYPDDLLEYREDEEDILRTATAEAEGPVWHPTQKPLALGRHLVRTYSNPGDLVLDNAFGSCSFLVSALAEGRNFLGIERNEHTARFKGTERVDLMFLARARLWEVWKDLPETQRSTLVPSGLLQELDSQAAVYADWLTEQRRLRHAPRAR